jgi:predicted  nucleic acid-binding Zn-ribbon protein
LKDQLRLLIELQVHDAKIQELETALKAFPAQLDAMQGDLRRVEALLERERVQLSETESWRKRQAEDARDQEEALIRAKQRSQMVKNVKEHMANERELETTRKNSQARDEEVARLGNAVEAARAGLAQHEGELATMKTHIAEQESDVRAKMAGVEAQIAAARGGRESAASRVEAAALKRYSSIRMRRGMALAPVKAGTCQGCHMNIPPQLFNVLQRGTSIEICPNCNRIIYWDRLLNPDGEPSQKAELKKPEAKKAAPRRAKASAPNLPSTLPKPDPKPVPRGPLAAPAGSMPGAAGVASADTLRSSQHHAPDTATGPSTAPEGEPQIEESDDAHEEPVLGSPQAS